MARLPCEPPWVRWRLGLLDYYQLRAGVGGSVERCLELCRGQVAEVAVEPGGVVPVDPAESGELDVLDGLPGSGAGGSADQLGLVVAVDGLGKRVIEGVADRPD